MADDEVTFGEVGAVRGVESDDSVVVRPRPVGVMGEAAGSAGALALAALILATATLLTMSVAADFGDAKVYSASGLNELVGIRWIAGTRLVIAGLAMLLAVLAGVRYARRLPATRYVFTDDGADAAESREGDEQPGWIKLLVGASIVLSILALLLNVAALAVALHAHQSPSFGIPRA